MITNKRHPNPKRQAQIDRIREILTAAGVRATVTIYPPDEIHIEPDTKTTGNQPAGAMHGMQINGFPDGIWEVSEYQAGPNQDRLHIYKTTTRPATAARNLLKGNNQKPIKIY